MQLIQIKFSKLGVLGKLGLLGELGKLGVLGKLDELGVLSELGKLGVSGELIYDVCFTNLFCLILNSNSVQFDPNSQVFILSFFLHITLWFDDLGYK